MPTTAPRAQVWRSPNPTLKYRWFWECSCNIYGVTITWGGAYHAAQTHLRAHYWEHCQRIAR